MGLTYADIQLFNGDDLALIRRGYMPKGEARTMEVSMLVDSGAYMLVINEDIKIQLGLEKTGEEQAVLADNSRILVEIAGPVEVRFKNRRTVVEALVMPGNTEPLLGAIPLEGLDVMIDPRNQTLIIPPSRPYIAQTILK
jgi:clan AA aspartic protease